MEIGLTFTRPLKYTSLLQQRSHWLGDFGEALNEPAVITRESQKTQDVGDIFGLNLIKNFLNLARVNSNSALRQYTTQKSDFLEPKLTHAKHGIELVVSKSAKNNMEMLRMFRFSLGVYKNVVDQNHDKLVEFLHEDCVHQIH